jgi:hypothetical protein
VEKAKKGGLNYEERVLEKFGPVIDYSEFEK